MSRVQGMTEITMEEMKGRVPPSIEEVGDAWVAEKWNENWLGCQRRYTLRELEAHRKFLGVAKLGKENLVFLISRDAAMPKESRCHQCHQAIQLPVRWYGLTEDGFVEQDTDRSVKEYGLTTILWSPKGPFVAKFCLACQMANELSHNPRWTSYAKSIAEIALIVERKNAHEARERAKAFRAKKAAETSAVNIAAMLPEEVDVMTEADLLN